MFISLIFLKNLVSNLGFQIFLIFLRSMHVVKKLKDLNKTLSFGALYNYYLLLICIWIKEPVNNSFYKLLIFNITLHASM